LRTIIADKDEEIRKTLFFRIEANCPKLKVDKIVQSLDEATAYFSHYTTNITFLSIFLFREKDFELLPFLKTRSSNAIFTSINDPNIIRAMRASSVNFLIKPITIPQLLICIQRCVNQTPEEYLSTLEILRGNLNKDLEIKKIFIKQENGHQIIITDDLLYCKELNNQTIFVIQNGKEFISEKPLQYYEDFFNSSNFARIDKRTIINLRCMNSEGIIKSQIVLNDTHQLTVSTNYCTDLTAKLKNLSKIKYH
jgi:two-component system, LytTR family, response regulator